MNLSAPEQMDENDLVCSQIMLCGVLKLFRVRPGFIVFELFIYFHNPNNLWPIAKYDSKGIFRLKALSGVSWLWKFKLP